MTTAKLTTENTPVARLIAYEREDLAYYEGRIQKWEADLEASEDPSEREHIARRLDRLEKNAAEAKAEIRRLKLLPTA